MANPAATSTVGSLLVAAFDRPRDPRSAAYIAGVRAHLEYAINDKKTALPYKLGSAEADAFFAGADEGRAIVMRGGAKRANSTSTKDLNHLLLAVEAALDCIAKDPAPSTPERQAALFVAYLSGGVKHYDAALGQRIFDIVSPADDGAA